MTSTRVFISLLADKDCDGYYIDVDENGSEEQIQFRVGRVGPADQDTPIELALTAEEAGALVTVLQRTIAIVGA